MNLADNLPNSKLIDIVRAYYESRGAEVNIRKGGGMVINPFANCLTSFTRSNSDTIAILTLKSADNFVGESYFFSCVASSVAADYVRLTLFKAGGKNEQIRYIEKEGLTGGGSLINCRISFKEAQHQYTQIAVSFEGYSSASAAASATFTDVMLSRSDVLTPYTSDYAETEEQLTMLESMDVAVSYPFATAIAGKPVFWRSWKLGGYNAPAKTVTAGYSSGLTDPVLSVTKNSVGGVDTSAINIGINGKATTGHYLDEKGAPLSGLFFSSRKDLQTSAGFLVKWIFAACARKLTITSPRGGAFGEVMEEQDDTSTNYYMFAPRAQPLNGYTINIPSVPTSRALVAWRAGAPRFSYDDRLFAISYAESFFLGSSFLTINLKEVKPANDMVTFAAEHPDNTATDKWSVNILGFTRREHHFSKTNVTAAGMMPETVTLRNDAPCRFVETWLLFQGSPDEVAADKSAQKIDVFYNGQHYRYDAYDKDANCGLVYIIAFKSGITTPQKTQYNNRLVVVGIPDNVSAIQIGYYTSKTGYSHFNPDLYYYQLNQN